MCERVFVLELMGVGVCVNVESESDPHKICHQLTGMLPPPPHFSFHPPPRQGKDDKKDDKKDAKKDEKKK